MKPVPDAPSACPQPPGAGSRLGVEPDGQATSGTSRAPEAPTGELSGDGPSGNGPSGDPASGSGPSSSGRSSSGRSSSGPSGDTASGDTASGDTASGDTASGNAASGNGASGDRPSRWKSFRLRRQVRWTLTILVLVFVGEYIVLPELAKARQSVDTLGKVSVPYLILGVILEVAALLSYAELSRSVLEPDAPNRFRMFRINMSTLAVSHILPGGTAPGSALGYRLLTDSGVPGSTAAFGLATQGVGSAVVLNLIFWLALLISIPLEGFNPLYGIAAIAGILLLAAFAGTILLLTRGRQRSAERLFRIARHVPFVDPATVRRSVQGIADRVQVLLKDRRMLKRALLWAALNWLLDAASLWVFLYAFGSTVFPIDLLVAYGLANVLAVLPITPGGLGVIEGVLIPTLVGFGVPRADAILGVLTYRLVNFWLPIPTGGIAYLSLRFRGGHGRNGASGANATAVRRGDARA